MECSFGESEQELAFEPSSSRKKNVRFSLAQQSCLVAFFRNGMTGVSKQHAALIEKAAKDSQLTTEQVEICNDGMHIRVCSFM